MSNISTKWTRKFFPHEARFGRATTFFTFVFNSGTDVPFDALADKLLDSGIAECALSPATGQVRVSPNISELAKLKDKAQTLIDVESIVDGRLKWGDASWKARIAASKMLFSSASSSILGSKSRLATEDDESSSQESASSSMHQTIEEIDETATQRLIQMAVHAHVDGMLYRPGYLESEPYLRLELRPFGIKTDASTTATTTEPDEFYDDWIHPSLLLHRSGVTLLTLGVQLPPTPKFEELVPKLSARGLMVSAAIIPEPVIEAAARTIGASKDDFAGRWTSSIREGVRWRDFRSDEPFAIQEAFEIYQQALFAFSGVPATRSDWFCYPTTFVENLDCCGSRNRWLRRHDETLACLAARTDIRGRASEKFVTDVLIPDMSLTEDSSLYIPGGMTTSINWNFENNSDFMIGDYFMRTTVSENALLQYWQLVALDDAISSSRGTLPELIKLQRTAIYGLEEIQRNNSTYGTASDIAQRTFETFGGAQLLSRIKARLAEIHQLISTQEGTRAARRANRFAFAAVMAALFFALPAIEQTISITQRAIEGDLVTGWAWNLLVDQPSNKIAIFVYVSIILVTALVYTVSQVVGARKRRYIRTQVRDIGQAWHGPEINVEFIDSEPRADRPLQAKLRRRLGGLIK